MILVRAGRQTRETKNPRGDEGRQAQFFNVCFLEVSEFCPSGR